MKRSEFRGERETSCDEAQGTYGGDIEKMDGRITEICIKPISIIIFLSIIIIKIAPAQLILEKTCQ